MWVYTLAGLLTGWAGVLLFAHGNGGDPNARRGAGTGGDRGRGDRRGEPGRRPGDGRRGAAGRADPGACLENGVSYFDVPVEVKYILIGTFVVVNTALSRLAAEGERVRVDRIN